MRKPSPDIYNLAKGTLGVDAADCLVIEDDQVLGRRMAAWCESDGRGEAAWEIQGTCCLALLHPCSRIVRRKAWNARAGRAAGSQGRAHGVPHHDVGLHEERRLQAGRSHRVLSRGQPLPRRHRQAASQAPAGRLVGAPTTRPFDAAAGHATAASHAGAVTCLPPAPHTSSTPTLHTVHTAAYPTRRLMPAVVSSCGTAADARAGVRGRASTWRRRAA